MDEDLLTLRTNHDDRSSLRCIRNIYDVTTIGGRSGPCWSGGAVLVVGHLVSLSASEDKSKDRQNEDVEDSDDGQDVGPAHLTLTDPIATGTLATDPPHVVMLPTVWKDDAAEEHEHS